MCAVSGARPEGEQQGKQWPEPVQGPTLAGEPFVELLPVAPMQQRQTMQGIAVLGIRRHRAVLPRGQGGASPFDPLPDQLERGRCALVVQVRVHRVHHPLVQVLQVGLLDRVDQLPAGAIQGLLEGLALPLVDLPDPSQPVCGLAVGHLGDGLGERLGACLEALLQAVILDAALDGLGTIGLEGFRQAPGAAVRTLLFVADQGIEPASAEGGRRLPAEGHGALLQQADAEGGGDGLDQGLLLIKPLSLGAQVLEQQKLQKQHHLVESHMGRAVAHRRASVHQVAAVQCRLSLGAATLPALHGVAQGRAQVAGRGDLFGGACGPPVIVEIQDQDAVEVLGPLDGSLEEGGICQGLQASLDQDVQVRDRLRGGRTRQDQQIQTHRIPPVEGGLRHQLVGGAAHEPGDPALGGQCLRRRLLNLAIEVRQELGRPGSGLRGDLRGALEGVRQGQ